MLSLHIPADRQHIAEKLKRLADKQGSLSPAVVVGTSINALGVARSLGREDIPVVWLTSNPGSFVNHSRYVCCYVSCEDVFYDQMIPALSDLAQLFPNPPVLFLTHDFQVERVSAQREKLSHLYRFNLPSKRTVDQLLSKVGFHELAVQSNLTVPKTELCQTSDELERWIKAIKTPGPWVVKPFQKSDLFEAVFGKAVKIGTMHEWAGFLNSYRAVEVPILIQSWIEGTDRDVAFCLVSFDPDGHPAASFVGRKIRQYLPEVGNTASAERFANRNIEERTIQFFVRNGFIGMGSMEYKFDQISREVYAVEPTVGRTNLQSEIATINGCNLPAIYYHGLMGNRSRQKNLLQRANCSTINRTWIRLGADTRSSLHYRRQRKLTIAELIRPYTKNPGFAVFRITDPLPFVRLLTAYITSMMIQILKRSGFGALKSLRIMAGKFRQHT